MARSPQPPRKPKPSNQLPDWLRYLLIVIALVIAVSALVLKIPEHQSEIIKVAIILLTVLVRPSGS